MEVYSSIDGVQKGRGETARTVGSRKSVVIQYGILAMLQSNSAIAMDIAWIHSVAIEAQKQLFCSQFLK